MSEPQITHMTLISQIFHLRDQRHLRNLRFKSVDSYFTQVTKCGFTSVGNTNLLS